MLLSQPGRSVMAKIHETTAWTETANGMMKIAKRGAAFRLLEELGTNPRVFFLPPSSRKYPAPDEKRTASAAMTMEHS